MMHKMLSDLIATALALAFFACMLNFLALYLYRLTYPLESSDVTLILLGFGVGIQVLFGSFYFFARAFDMVFH